MTHIFPTPEQLKNLTSASIDYPSITLRAEQLSTLELLLNGSFNPVYHYLGQADYTSILNHQCLANGKPWPLPIVLDVSHNIAETLTLGEPLALRDSEGFMHALLTLEEKWQPNKADEALALFNTRDKAHTGVQTLYQQTGDTYLAGTLRAIAAPIHHEFDTLWQTPVELKRRFAKQAWTKIIAYNGHTPIHQSEKSQLIDLAKELSANILLHPSLGSNGHNESTRYAVIQAYQAAHTHFPDNLSTLSLMPRTPSLAGTREIMLQALIHQNNHCTHLAINPQDFFIENALPSDIEQQIAQIQTTLQLSIHRLKPLAYDPNHLRFVTHDSENNALESFTHNHLIQALTQQTQIPSWFSYPNIIQALSHIYRPRNKQGFSLFFTGFSGSGKSTLAKILYAKLSEKASRPVTLLDGDVVRLNLSSELGFSKTHRHINIQRIGFVASEIVKNAGVAICAPIAPYAETRQAVRTLIEQQGAFIEIYVSTPLSTCESRDRKGLYAKARKGIISSFTGISDPYDVPTHAEITIDTTHISPTDAAHTILLYLFKEGYVQHVSSPTNLDLNTL